MFSTVLLRIVFELSLNTLKHILLINISLLRARSTYNYTIPYGQKHEVMTRSKEKCLLRSFIIDA